MSMNNEHEALNKKIQDWVHENYWKFLYNWSLDNLDDDDDHDPEGTLYEISHLILWGSSDEALLDTIGRMYSSCIISHLDQYEDLYVFKSKRRVETK